MLTGQAPIPRTTHVNVSEPNAGCGVSGSYGCGSFSSTSIGKGKPSAFDVCMKTLPVISRGRRNENFDSELSEILPCASILGPHDRHPHHHRTYHDHSFARPATALSQAAMMNSDSAEIALNSICDPGPSNDLCPRCNTLWLASMNCFKCLPMQWS